MFDTRFETKYGVRMSDFEISLARDIVAEIKKLALTACHMYQINRRNLLSEQPNFSRAERNILATIKNFMSNPPFSNFEVISGHGKYSISGKATNYHNKIYGTLFTFEIR